MRGWVNVKEPGWLSDLFLFLSFNFFQLKFLSPGKKSPILPNVHRNYSAEEGWGVSGKVISSFEPLGFGDGRLIQKLRFFLLLFFFNFLSQYIIPVANKTCINDIAQKKED